MCTIPSRVSDARCVIHRMLGGQTCPLNRIQVSLNGFGAIPDAFPVDPRVKYCVRPDNPGPWIRYAAADDFAAEDILLTLDDDVDYPPDYVERAVGLLRDEPQSVAGCFSAVSWTPFQDDFTYGLRRLQFMLEAPLSRSRRVALLKGQSGVFRSSHVAHIEPPLARALQMNDDMWIGREMQIRRVRIHCWPKAAGWISDRPSSGEPGALYRSRGSERAATFSRLVARGFDPTAEAEAEILATPERILVLSSCSPFSAGSERLDGALRLLCGPGRSVHLLCPVDTAERGRVQRMVDGPYWVHEVEADSTDGRGNGIALVRHWRTRRVARRNAAEWEERLRFVERALDPTRILDWREA